MCVCVPGAMVFVKVILFFVIVINIYIAEIDVCLGTSALTAVIYNENSEFWALVPESKIYLNYKWNPASIQLTKN